VREGEREGETERERERGRGREGESWRLTGLLNVNKHPLHGSLGEGGTI